MEDFKVKPILLNGNAVDQLKQLDACSVDCCVTSPPYYGLRDYGTGEWVGGDSNCDHKGNHFATKANINKNCGSGVDRKNAEDTEPMKSVCTKCGAVRVDEQIGLEETPEEYVAKLVDVFRDVRRVLRDDGTLWVNIADSYCGGGRGSGYSEKQDSNRGTVGMPKSTVPNECKQKDLIGIPWKLADALKKPYYSGKIKNELDRVWLAAMIDAEGSICGTEYQSGSRTHTGVYISVTNTSIPIIENCERIFPQSIKHVYEKTNGNSDRKCFRWDVERMDQKALFLRTIYPYLIAKRKQAIIGYTFIEMQCGLDSKKKGYLSEQKEKRSQLIRSLSLLNSGVDIDIPSWCIEPPSLFEQGYYLRQEIIWSKPNPMPESVTDRCTKSHESIFLLSKSARYYFDAKAIAEPTVTRDDSDRDRDLSKLNSCPGRTRMAGLKTNDYETRNKRDVWTMSSQPFSGAHFATFPMQLPETCVLAGSRIGGTVLDPFNGAGTTGIAAMNNGRNYIGIDLNAEYLEITRNRFAEEVQYATPLF